MKRVLASLAILVCLGFTTSTQPPATDFVVTGRIINASTGVPVTDATVVLENSGAVPVAAQSNDEGRFILFLESTSRPVELMVAHRCYHQVRIQLRGQALDGRRQVDVGLPPDKEIYGRNSPPLGGCETR